MIDISVVIPTYNSSRTLSKCLDSVKQQSVLPREIVMVDRFSADGTAEIGTRIGAKVIQAHAKRSIARNIGLEHCSSRGVLFVDSDMVMSSRVLEECIAGLETCEALVIPEVSVGTGFWASCKAMERKTNQGNGLIEAPRCFRRSALLSLGGYNPNLEAGEDWDLQNRVVATKLSIGRIESAILHDEGRPTLTSLVRKKYFYGKSIRAYLTANPTQGIKQLNPLRRIINPSMKASLTHPSLGAGILILKTLEFGGAGLGYLVGSKRHSENMQLDVGETRD